MKNLVLFTILALLVSCKGEFEVTDKAGGNENVGPGSELSFPGISAIDNVSGVSVRLNWTHVSGATQYFIYNMTSGSPIWVATVSAPTVTYNVTGLSPSTGYKFRVRLMDSQGLTDLNKNDVSATTASITATFNGWDLVRATGPKTPATQASDMGSESASVTLTWPAVTPSSGVVASYNIFRSTTSGGQSYSAPLATGISASTRSYTDNTVSASTPYYYTIAPVVSGNTVIPSPVADSEVTVLVPAANMALLHRWSANKEMCQQMGKTVLRSENYRCAVATGGSAPPGTGGSGYVDLEKSLFIDRYEQGCNYTATNSCTDATVSGGAASPCLGIRDTPNTNVSALHGSIYYSRYTGRCFLNTSGSGVTGTSWVEATSATAGQRELMGSNAPGLPPFVRIEQAKSQDVCNGQTVSGTPAPSRKRLMKRKEQLMATAWDSSIADATITDMETGLNLHSTGYCNSSYASPQGNNNTDISAVAGQNALGYTNTVSTNATNRDTLPGCLHFNCVADTTLTELIRSVRTGSQATNACVSRYGLQDLVGNVLEWTSDQINCTGTSCAGMTSGVNGTDDLVGVQFDGTQGPTANGTFTSHGRVQFPVGIPIASGAFGGDGVVSLTSTQFHGDSFYIAVTNAVRGSIVGGGWNFGSLSGRFALRMDNEPTVTARHFGFRCALPAE